MEGSSIDLEGKVIATLVRTVGRGVRAGVRLATGPGATAGVRAGVRLATGPGATAARGGEKAELDRERGSGRFVTEVGARVRGRLGREGGVGLN